MSVMPMRVVRGGAFFRSWTFSQRTTTFKMSYASVLQSSTRAPESDAVQNEQSTKTESTEPRSRSRSPQQSPRQDAEEEDVYVLTLLTDQTHHERMTEIRDKYFPKKINKLAAHLTLFHALPGSRLEGSLIPTIKDVASRSSRFSITAKQPFRLGKRGIAIAVPQNQGGKQAKEIRNALQAPWKQQGILSQQDAQPTGRMFPHYTVMNKVDDDAEVRKAEEELQNGFVPDQGVVEGLGLYLYDKGWWRRVRRFDFGGNAKVDQTCD